MRGEPWNSIIQIEGPVLYYSDKSFLILWICFNIQISSFGKKNNKKVKQTNKKPQYPLLI